MNYFWPSALRTCRSSKSIAVLPKSALQLSICWGRSYSASSVPIRRHVSNHFKPSMAFPRFSHVSILGPKVIRSYSSAPPIIKRYEDLPADYQDEEGLAYRNVSISEKESEKVFGRDLPDVAAADRVLRIIHGRRVAGTLNDENQPSLVAGPEGNIRESALAWLRKTVKVDERRAEEKRAEKELLEVEQELLTDAERLGIYMPNAPQTGKSSEGQSPYGRGVLDRLSEETKARNAKRLEEEKKARELQAAEITQNTGTLTTLPIRSRVELRRPGENARFKHYLERSKVLPNEVPEMSALQRIAPSAAFALLVTAGMVLFAAVYVPPETSARLFPDIPPAAATILGIIGANATIFLLWRIPPAWRLLNKYFIQIPGYPRAFAVLGNTFSQQTVRHLLTNMLIVWFIGTRLHEDIGRGNFLALYISTGVLSSLTSLVVFTARGVLTSSSLGASGAVFGVIAAYFWLHREDMFKFLGFPPEPISGIPGWLILTLSLLGELLSIRQFRKMKVGKAIDHYSHLGGFACGISGMMVMERYDSKVKRRAQRMIEERNARAKRRAIEVKPIGERKA